MKKLVTLMMLTAMVVMAAPGVGMADEVFTKNVEADAWLAGSNGSSAYGTTKDEFRVGYNWGAKHRGILRFDLTDYQAAGIKSVVLKIYSMGAYAADYAIHGVSDDTWVESTVTWNNQPGHDATASATLTDTLVVGYNDWDITDLAKANLAAPDGKLSLMMLQVPETTTIGAFWAKEKGAAYIPKLIVTTPEPATMTLLLLGLPFALRRRR